MENPLVYLDKSQWESLVGLFDDAEAAIKDVEGLDLGLAIPSINQLRYVGRHLLDALGKSGADQEEEIKRAQRNAQRAIYDAKEICFSFLIFEIDHFRKSFEDIPIANTIGDYVNWMATTREARHYFTNPKRRGDDRWKYYQGAKEHVTKLWKIYYQLPDAEEELKKVRDAKKSDARRFWISITIATTLSTITTSILIYLHFIK